MRIEYTWTDAVKDLLTARKNQAELARELGIAQSGVSDLATGDRRSVSRKLGDRIRAAHLQFLRKQGHVFGRRGVPTPQYIDGPLSAPAASPSAPASADPVQPVAPPSRSSRGACRAPFHA